MNIHVETDMARALSVTFKKNLLTKICASQFGVKVAWEPPKKVNERGW